MSAEAIERRLAELTARLERLEKKVQPVWRDMIGIIPDDEISREAVRVGEEWRKSEGEKH
jgi:hypothetical protein